MACVNIDHDQYYLPDGVPNPRITIHLERIAQFTGTDIFVLKPLEPTSIVAVDQGCEASQNRRLKISIFGDYESVEHAKTRVLIMIDDLVSLVFATMPVVIFPVSSEVLSNPRALLAGTRSHLYVHGAVGSEHDLRSCTQKCQIDRVRYKNRHLLSSSVSPSVRIFTPGWHPARSRPNIHHRQFP